MCIYCIYIRFIHIYLILCSNSVYFVFNLVCDNMIFMWIKLWIGSNYLWINLKFANDLYFCAEPVKQNYLTVHILIVRLRKVFLLDRMYVCIKLQKWTICNQKHTIILYYYCMFYNPGGFTFSNKYPFTKKPLSVLSICRP